MKDFNFKGVTREAVTNVCMLIVALINAILQMFGVNALPIEDKEISVIISGIFLVGMALWNTWKNRNVSKASQIAQDITDMIKNGELLAEDVQALISKVKKQERDGAHEWMQ